MGIFKEICETRVVGSRLQYLGMKQRLQQAISRRVAHAFDLVFHSRFEPVGARSCVFLQGRVLVLPRGWATCRSLHTCANSCCASRHCPAVPELVGSFPERNLSWKLMYRS
jgi:hypothetical protein